MEQSSTQHAWGVFKPVGHVVIAFPSREQADSAAQALTDIGFGGTALRRLSDRDMLAQSEQDIDHSGFAATVGQDLNLIKAQHALAKLGYHWLVVHAPHADQARRVVEVARRHGAERAQSYGNFIIEELIDHAADRKQVAESPDRGLDSA